VPDEGRWRPGFGAVAAIYAVGLLSWRVANHGPPHAAGVAIAVYAAGLLLGPSVVYAVLRRGGSRVGRAASVALGIPLLWLVKELVRVSAVHPPAESLYYALNPVAVGVYCAAVVPMALVEVEFRWRSEGPSRREAVRGWPAWVLGAFVLLAATAAAVGYDNGGREIFYAYVALYRVLFSSGS
jgi:hypothetical protein